MMEDIIDYSDDYYNIMLVQQSNQDMKLWDWNDNKYSSLIEHFKDLGIEKIRHGCRCFVCRTVLILVDTVRRNKANLIGKSRVKLVSLFFLL
jgi:hypothetical protein